MKKVSPQNQLRWVILLLAVAVILPTVCLLWFMMQAVKNERLAIRQKLIDSYTGRAEEIFFKYPDEFWANAEKNLAALSESNDISAEKNSQSNFSAVVIYDANSNIQYPVQTNQRIDYSSEAVKKVWKLEYSDGNCVEAIKEYDKIAKISSIPDEVYECQMGVIRCLSKQNKYDEAIKICREWAYPGKSIINELSPEQISRAKLMLANLYSKMNKEDLFKEIQNQIVLYNSADKHDSNSVKKIPTATKIFMLESLIKLAKDNELAERLKAEIEEAVKVIEAESITLEAAETLDDESVFESWQQGTFRKIGGSNPLYGIYLKTDKGRIMGVIRAETMTQFWQKCVDDFTDKLVFCRIYDEKGNQIAGELKEYIGREVIFGEVFSTQNLKKYFANWKVELYLRAGVFKEAADRKRFIYIWVAATVIIFMLASMVFAGRAVVKQARLNKLKNDFIATVTHELKTPLSSMRVLVDTLLEGRCESQQQATDYLKLISKENSRLSRLIDNFLTFSRMERNKKAFDFSMVSPVEIANIAADAMRAKFEQGKVRFNMDVVRPVPMINADKDAMVTVLVNLLDNAYKYSNDDKQIELKVYAQNHTVCFSVRDNGIGMSKRVMKKIFDRFYQADNSLSRRAEGAGLGLSIVKFIVDAHKGKIEVESKVGKGSEFKVLIHAQNNH